MKNLFKKSLSVLMITFLTVFVLALGNKVSAASETVDWTAAPTSADASTVVWEGTQFTITLAKNTSSTAANNYLGGSKAHTRIYKGQTLTFAPASGYKIDSIVITSTASSYAGYFVSGTWSNATATSSGSTVTVTPTDGSANSVFTVGTATRATKIVVNYSVAGNTPNVEVTGDTYTEIDDVVALTATLTNITGTVTWSSSNTDVATVDQSGNVTAKAFGQTTITANCGGTEGTLLFTVYPTDGTELTIAEALQVCEYTDTTECVFTYSVVGTIESIDTAYNASYGNITVTITDGTDSIKAYRMTGGEELIVGDKIKVTGTLVNYSGNTPEFVQGCTYVAVEDSADVANLKEALNAINSYMTMAYKYTVEEVAAPSSYDIVSSELGIANGVAVEELSNGVATLTFAKGSNANNAPKYYASGEAIRCYGGNTITITSSVNITSIELTFGTSDGSNTITANCGTYSDGVWTGESTEVVFTIGGTSGNRRIAGINVSYDSSAELTATEYSNVDFRIRCGVDLAVKDIEGATEYGILVTAGDKTVNYAWNETDGIYGSDATCLFVTISLGDALTNKERLSTEFTVCAYVVVDGVTYTSTSTKTYSVESMVNEYYAADATKDLVADLYNRISQNLI